MSIVATQTEGSSGIQAPRRLLLDAEGNLIPNIPQSLRHTSSTSTFSSIPGSLLQGITSSLASAFLPTGYPNSVTPDYLSFQIWDTLQALSSYVRGMLSTQAMLKGIGVGSAAATPASAVVQFFYRDAVGLLAGVFFAALQGSSFDAYAKQWRLVADVANDIGLTAELAAPAFSPNIFLLLACIGSICRAITGVAGGATRMALTQHFALQGNAADIAAKEGSQETAVTLLGMILGLGLTRIAENNVLAAWSAFIAMTVLHVYANMRAMRCLCITRLNSERLDIIVEKFSKTEKVPTPMEIASLERLMPPVVSQWFGSFISIFGKQNKQWSVVIAPDLSSLNTKTRKIIADQFSNRIIIQSGSIEKSTAFYAIDSGIMVVPDPGNKQMHVFIVQTEEKQAGGGDDGRDCQQFVHGYCKARYMALQLENRGKNNESSCDDQLFDSKELDTRRCNVFASGGWVALLTKAGWCCDRPALSQGRMKLQFGEVGAVSKKKN